MSILTKTTYTYSLLQYRHSQKLGEVVNIAVILFVPIHRRAVFRPFSKRIDALKYLYPNFEKNHIEKYLNAFEKRAETIDRWSESQLKAYIQDSFLQRDATSLAFGTLKTGLLYTYDFDRIADDLMRSYSPCDR